CAGLNRRLTDRKRPRSGSAGQAESGCSGRPESQCRSTRSTDRLAANARAICVCLYPSVHPSISSGRTEKALTLNQTTHNAYTAPLKVTKSPDPHIGKRGGAQSAGGFLSGTVPISCLSI